MNITYLDHSAYFIEMEDCCFLFDDTKGVLPEWDHSKKLYVFVSHHHEDHYQPIIFNLRKETKQLTYLISDDVSCQVASDTIMLKANQQLILDDLRVETFPSSDEGVAFLIETKEGTIYHAGDLNWWHWEDENSDAENDEARALFEKGIESLKGRDIDVAFLVLDPRQKEQFYYGFDAWMRMTHTSYAFPMHMWGKYSIVEKLKRLSVSEPYRDAIMDVHKENQQFTIEVL